VNPEVQAKLDALESAMRKLHDTMDPKKDFRRFLSGLAMDLWHLQEVLKERDHKATTGRDLDAERKRVFEMVQDKEHWKNRINATLDELSEEDEKLLYDAIPFYTSSVPTIRRLKSGKVKVTAAGYWATVGG